MHTPIEPDWVPSHGVVPAGVSENVGPLPHALLELDRETEQRRIGQFQGNQASMSERDIHRALGLSAVPLLSGGYLSKQPANQLAGALGVRKFKKDVTGNGQIVPTQSKTLDVGLVELTHCARRS